MKGTVITLFVVALLVVLAGLIFWLSGSPEPAKSSPEILSFDVERPNFVIETRDIASLDVFGIRQNSTGTTTDGDVRLGTPAKTSQENNTATWQLPIPENPLDITGIYAVGYNEEGEEVDQQSLPYTGPREIFEALWLQRNESAVTLGIGDATTVQGTTITLTDVTDDTRCRSGEVCEEEGGVNAVLTVTTETEGEESKSEELIVAGPGEQEKHNSFMIQILNVEPSRPAEGEVAKEDYVLRFFIFRESKL